MLRILVVDDEVIARNSVLILLEKCSNVSKVDQAESGEQAIKLIANNQYDIVFLDIQMPGGSGLEVAQRIPESTAIIFATAYNQYAVEAFDFHAVDYLLKPFDDQRFYQAFERVIERCRGKVAAKNVALFESLNHVLSRKQDTQTNKLVLKETGKIKLIEMDTIKYVKGAGSYVEIVLKDEKTLLHRETLGSIEEKLAQFQFSRIHKSTIVNNNLVTELRPTPKGDYVVKLSSGEELMMSRGNKDKLKVWMT